MSTARIMPHVAPQRISPRQRVGAISARDLSDLIVMAAKAATNGEWMKLRPEGVSKGAWKAIQLLRQPMKVDHLAHVLLRSARARDGVLGLLTATDERCRRRGPRRAKSGRRAIDAAVAK